MKRKFITYTIAGLVAVLAFGSFIIVTEAATSSATTAITLDKLDYAFGENMVVTISAHNGGYSSMTLNFPTACQVEFKFNDLAPVAQFCAQVLTEVTIKPGETHEWKFDVVPADLSSSGEIVLTPGEHLVTGYIIGYESSVATQTFTVEYAAQGEGKFCGGIAAFQCPADLSCHYDGNYPDAGGYCVSNQPSGDFFSDVPQSHWAYQYIKEFTAEGIIQGYGDGTFHPDQPITRAELTKIALLTFGIDSSTTASGSFTDLDEWQKQWVYAAYDRNIISGYSTTIFGPNRNITRAEALKIMILAKGVTEAQLNNPDIMGEFSFSDVRLSDWFYVYVKYAVTNDVAKGYGDGTFGARANLTRAEATKMLSLLRDVVLPILPI